MAGVVDNIIPFPGSVANSMKLALAQLRSSVDRLVIAGNGLEAIPEDQLRIWHAHSGQELEVAVGNCFEHIVRLQAALDRLAEHNRNEQAGGTGA